MTLAFPLDDLPRWGPFLVGKRTREIGIRIALGGRPILVVVGMLLRSLRQVVAGVAIGVASMWPLRMVTLTSVSWQTLLVVSGAAIAAGCAATLAPALRAARVQPTVAIHTER